MGGEGGDKPTAAPVQAPQKPLYVGSFAKIAFAQFSQRDYVGANATISNITDPDQRDEVIAEVYHHMLSDQSLSKPKYKDATGEGISESDRNVLSSHFENLRALLSKIVDDNLRCDRLADLASHRLLYRGVPDGMTPTCDQLLADATAAAVAAQKKYIPPSKWIVTTKWLVNACVVLVTTIFGGGVTLLGSAATAAIEEVGKSIAKTACGARDGQD